MSLTKNIQQKCHKNTNSQKMRYTAAAEEGKQSDYDHNNCMPCSVALTHWN